MNDRAILVGCGKTGCQTLRRSVELLGHPELEFMAHGIKEEDVAYSGCRRRVVMRYKGRDRRGSSTLPQDIEMVEFEHDMEVIRTLSRANMVITLCDMEDADGAVIDSLVGILTRDSSTQRIAVVSVPVNSEKSSSTERTAKLLKMLRESMRTVILIPEGAIRDPAGDADAEGIGKTIIEIMALVARRLTEAVLMHNHVPLDLGDITCIFNGGRLGMVGIGRCDLQKDMVEALKEALSSPFLDRDLIREANVLSLVTGGDDLRIKQVENLAGELHERIDLCNMFIWGSRRDARMGQAVEVLLIFVVN